MKALLSGILFLVAAGFVAAILVGAAVKLTIFLVVLAGIAAAGLYIAVKVFGPPSHLPGEGPDLDHAKR